MTPQQQVARRQPVPSVITQKVQLIYKLFLLENARSSLEQELLNFTNKPVQLANMHKSINLTSFLPEKNGTFFSVMANTFVLKYLLPEWLLWRRKKKAYEEVQSFFSSSFPSCVFSDLAKALDSKCQAFDKLSALLKDITFESHICVKNGARKNQLHSLGNKGILMTDVLKFGPLLQNSLTESSIAKAVQVFGATVPFQRLKHFLVPEPAVAQQDDTIYGIASSNNSTVSIANSSSYLKAEENENAVAFEEKHTPDILPSGIIQSSKISLESPPLLLPPTQAIIPEVSNLGPIKTTQLLNWGFVDDIQVQHQKQTSSQLLHFLKAKSKNMNALDVTVMNRSKESMCTSVSPQLMSPTVKTQTYQPRHVVTDNPIYTQTPKTFSADIKNQIPVFTVKRVESSGSLTYTYVTATKTELWDIGDIVTEVRQGDSEAGTPENKAFQNIEAQVENTCLNIHWKVQSLQSTGPEQEGNSAAAKKPVINGITIPEFKIQRFEETEVVVSHVVTPGDFYVQQAQSAMKLQALVTDSWNASGSYAEQNCIPDIGTKVMGWFPKQEQWCRAQVTKICGVSGAMLTVIWVLGTNTPDGAECETSIKVEVKRLDHGDTACLTLWNIKELTPEMAALPLQALQVSLANVMPVNGSDWSEEAVGWFHSMVHNRTLYARLYPQGPKVTAELFLEKGRLGAMRRGPPLSLRLAQNGHAIHSKQRSTGPVKSKALFKLT